MNRYINISPTSMMASPRRSLLLKKWTLIAVMSVDLFLVALIVLCRRAISEAFSSKMVSMMAPNNALNKAEMVAYLADLFNMALLLMTPICLLITAYYAYGILEEVLKTARSYAVMLLGDALVFFFLGFLFSPVFFLFIPLFVGAFMVARAYARDLAAQELAKMAAAVVEGVVENGAVGDMAFRKI